MLQDLTKLKMSFDFSEALQKLKRGDKLAREGWNGKNMFVVLMKGYPDGVRINANTAEALCLPEGTVKKFLPYLMMSTAGGECVPWLASMTDLLSEDWIVIA